MKMAPKLDGSKHLRSGFLAMLLPLLCSATLAAEPVVQVDHAWVRQAVKGQSGTGGFMTLTSKTPLTLVGFTTPAAASAELHEMSMQGDVMRMRAIAALPLPAGKLVELKPGGHHLMLMGLKQVLPVGQQLPLTLLMRDEHGKLIQQAILVPVLASAPEQAATEASPHDHH